MKTQRIARGGLTPIWAPITTEDDGWVELRFAKGQFYVKYGKEALRKISPREAIKIFLHFINNGEADSSDLTPLIEAVSKIGRELPFEAGSKSPWCN